MFIIHMYALCISELVFFWCVLFGRVEKVGLNAEKFVGCVAFHLFTGSCVWSFLPC